MSIIRYAVRSGAYHDSIVLMQLQSALLDLPGVEDVGVVMATPANRSMLGAQGLLSEAAPDARAEDLLVALRATDEAAASAALGEVDGLLARRRSETPEGDDEDPPPRSLRTAVRQAPGARWALVSVPGRYAAEVAREALEKNLHVFLYSDNVPIDEEAELKRLAQGKGLMVLGPDCGTAVIGGTGLGFANRVRRGPIGLVAASGTGLQAVSARIHDLGSGISQAIGTGGRDLSDAVGAITAHQSLDLLANDPDTRVIVLISKPPSPHVAGRLLARAAALGKPVVVAFLGYPSPGQRLGPLHFARDLDEAARLAVELAVEPVNEKGAGERDGPTAEIPEIVLPPSRRYVRGLFSGGTLALQALLGLRTVFEPMYSNLHLGGVRPLDDPHTSVGHSIVDLGADELTVGRLHPMMDPDGCRRRLEREAADPEAGVLLIDVVLGDVAHVDPAAELAPTLSKITGAPNPPAVVALVVGTDEDPQEAERQVAALRRAGAVVARRLPEALDAVLALLANPGGATDDDAAPDEAPAAEAPAVRAEDLAGPLSVINIGLDVFHHSLLAQGADCVRMDWRPPAGGNERLRTILRRLKS